MAFPRPTPAGAWSLVALVGALDLSPSVVVGTPDTIVSGVTLDSRSVHPGDLYAALPGAHSHGARYADSAAAAGAAAVLTDPKGAQLLDEISSDLPRIVVADPRAILGAVSAVVYGTRELAVRLVGITGTNGKTTTTYLVDSALRALGCRTGLIGTVETRIGEERIKSVRTTPEAPDLHALLAVMAQRGVDVCVMEVSSHALSQHRVDGVRYDVAAFTNLSQDHLDFHDSMADYFDAKAGLFTPERAEAAIICVDDDWGRRLAGQTTIPAVTVGSHPGVVADWTVSVSADEPQAFRLTGPDDALDLRAALPGDFNRVNTAVAALVLRRLGYDTEQTERAVLADAAVPGRMEVVRATAGSAPSDPLAVVDYAHSPDAVGVALEALRAHTPGCLVVVLGAGGDRDRGKRTAMGAAAAAGADLVVITDDNPRSESPEAIRAALLEGSRSAGAPAEIVEVPDRGAAIRYAVQRARAAGPGATVAVVGKGHETGQEIAGVVHPFDDREAVRAALDEVGDPA